MVQAHPDVTLTLKYLSPLGGVVSAEQNAAMDHSLPIKRAEAALKTLTLWGKFTTQNGRDYLVAEGHNDALLHEGSVLFDARYFYSQDGVKWDDFPSVPADIASRAGKIKSMLTGDIAKVYEIIEDDPNQPEPVIGEDGQPVVDEEGPKKLTFNVPELAVLKDMVDNVNAACGVVPVAALQADSLNHIVPNKLFSGAPYPEKLESYMHRTTPPGGRSLAQDMRGMWSLQYDSFKCIATLRSLLFPGYFFYYNAHEGTWGQLYCGDGMRNNDLIFML